MSELEKKDIGHEDVHMSDIEFVSQNEVDEIMKKYDRESNTRIWEGTPGMVVRYALAAFSVFMIWMNLFATWDERIRRSIFVGLLILFTFIIYPLRKGKPGKPNSMPWYDIVLALVGSSCFFYFALNLKEITAMATRITQSLIVIPDCGKHMKNWSIPNGKCYLKGVAFALNAIAYFIWIMMIWTNTASRKRSQSSR